MRLFGPNVARLREKKDVAGLVQALSDKDEGVRKDAVEALVFIGAGPDVLELALRSRAWWVWVSTAKLIARKGDTRAVPGLAAGLAVDEPSVRWAAMEALLRMSPGMVREVWLAALALPYPEVRNGAAQALGAGGSGGTGELLKALASASHAARAGLVQAIGMTGAPEAVPAIVAVLEDRANLPEARVAAVEALGRLRDRAAVEPLVSTLSEPEVAPIACAALGELGDARAVTPLVQCLAGPDGVTRKAALAALVKLGPASVPDLSVAVLEADDSASELACEALAKLRRPPGEGPALALYLARLREWDRCRALGPDLAVPALLRVLRSSDRHALHGASSALAEIGEPALEPLLATLTDERTAEGVCLALAGLRNERAIAPLAAALVDARRSDEARVHAATALGKIGDARAVEPLAAALWASSGALQKAACGALRGIGEPAIPVLVAAVRGADEALAALALAGLEHMGWRPESTEAAAFYWARRRDWARCAELGAAAIPALVEVVRTFGRSDGESVAGAMTAIGPGAHGALASFLLDPDWDVRGAVVRALTGGGWRPTTADEVTRLAIARGDWKQCVQLGTGAVGPLVAALGINGMREDAAGALGQIAERTEDRSDLAGAVEPLIEALSRPFRNESHPDIVIVALGRIGDPRAVPPLLPLLEGERHRQRIVTAKALGEIGDGRAVRALARAARDTEGETAAAASIAIAQIAARSADAGAFDVLGELLGEERDVDCVRLAEALRPAGRPALDWLVALMRHRDARRRTRAAEVLEALGDTAAVDALGAALDDEDLGVRTAASHALGALGTGRAVPPLLEALQRGGIDVPVMQALAKLGDRRAIEPLAARLPASEEEALASDQAALTCAEALDQLGYQPDPGPPAVVFWALKARPLFLQLGHASEYFDRRAAAVKLVEWYQQGLLGPGVAQALLARREYINAPHEERSFSNDCGTHIDKGGLGVSL
ncbi:MAG: HEAT repeat domain-containing protein [Thermoanaerobaculaceae bacterium]